MQTDTDARPSFDCAAFKKSLLQHSLKEIERESAAGPYFLNCHGIRLGIHFRSRELRNLFNVELGALHGPGPAGIHIDWFAAEDLAGPLSEKFDNEENPDLLEEDGIVTQRDFVATSLSPKHFVIVTRARSTDGVFNALRWLLPVLLLERGGIVLHSSCVVSRQQRACFFLGPSGAGKTTVASLAGDRVVLSDDMNVCLNASGEIFAERAVLGGNPLYTKAPFQKPYPVHGFYWLKKGAGASKTALSPAALFARLASSCPLGTWSGHKASQESLMRILTGLVSSVPGYELQFEKKNDFWRLIDE